jgi:hypothetical protein
MSRMPTTFRLVEGVDFEATADEIGGDVGLKVGEGDHPASRLDKLLPWQWKDRAAKMAA